MAGGNFVNLALARVIALDASIPGRIAVIADFADKHVVLYQCSSGNTDHKVGACRQFMRTIQPYFCGTLYDNGASVVADDGRFPLGRG